MESLNKGIDISLAVDFGSSGWSNVFHWRGDELNAYSNPSVTGTDVGVCELTVSMGDVNLAKINIMNR